MHVTLEFTPDMNDPSSARSGEEERDGGAQSRIVCTKISAHENTQKHAAGTLIQLHTHATPTNNSTHPHIHSVRSPGNTQLCTYACVPTTPSAWRRPSKSTRSRCLTCVGGHVIGRYLHPIPTLPPRPSSHVMLPSTDCPTQTMEERRLSCVSQHSLPIPTSADCKLRSVMHT